MPPIPSMEFFISAAVRLDVLLTAMAADPIAPEENVVLLREGLAEHFKNDRYLKCGSMGALVRENLATLRHNIHQGLGALKADQPWATTSR